MSAGEEVAHEEVAHEEVAHEEVAHEGGEEVAGACPLISYEAFCTFRH